MKRKGLLILTIFNLILMIFSALFLLVFYLFLFIKSKRAINNQMKLNEQYISEVLRLYEKHLKKGNEEMNE